MIKKHWLLVSFFGFFVIVLLGLFAQVTGFNNQMISLDEMKKAELETTRVEYGQCIVKILETNQIAKSYHRDVMDLAGKAGANLQQFDSKLLALIGTQVMPKLSPRLRESVQEEIISCRNAYTGRVNFGLKPLYINFNQLQRQFPFNLYNGLFFHWQTEDLKMPEVQTAEMKDFQNNKITPIQNL